MGRGVEGEQRRREINLISRQFTILGSVVTNPWISRREQKSRDDVARNAVHIRAGIKAGVCAAGCREAKPSDRIVITNDATISSEHCCIHIARYIDREHGEF